MDGKEHPLHRVRQWGFEDLPNGQVRFYTRAASIPDIKAAEVFGANGERDMWTSMLDSLDQKVERDGGHVQPGSREVWQERGPTPNQLRGTP